MTGRFMLVFTRLILVETWFVIVWTRFMLVETRLIFVKDHVDVSEFFSNKCVGNLWYKAYFKFQLKPLNHFHIKIFVIICFAFDSQVNTFQVNRINYDSIPISFKLSQFLIIIPIHDKHTSLFTIQDRWRVWSQSCPGASESHYNYAIIDTKKKFFLFIS